jgi:thioredoxin 1
MILSASARTIEVTTETFAAVFARPLVLLSWISRSYTSWRAFATVYEQAAQRHPDVAFGLVDIDQQRHLAAAFVIREIPTVTAFHRYRLVSIRAGFQIDESLDALVRTLEHSAGGSR